MVATILSSTERIVIGSHQFLNRWQQHATGMLHLRSSNLGRDDKKDRTEKGSVFLIFLDTFDVAISINYNSQNNRKIHQLKNDLTFYTVYHLPSKNKDSPVSNLLSQELVHIDWFQLYDNHPLQ